MSKVRYIYRAPNYGHSIERVFEDIRSALPATVEQSEFYCPYRRLSLLKLFSNFKSCTQLDEKINHITGDVYYLALGLPRAGLILTIHDCGHIPNLRGWKRWIYSKFWFSWPVRRAEVTTFISDYSKKELENQLGRKITNAVVIPDPVSAKFQFFPKAFHADKPRILTLGTKPNKNLARLAEAITGLRVHIRIIGPLSEEQVTILNQYSIDYSSAQKLTFDQIVDEYKQADIVSLVSTHEGFGLPIVEAQATGRIVVAGNVCSMPEVAGEAAVLVDPFDCSSIRQGFERVLRDDKLRGEMVDKGLNNAKRFHAESVAEQYAEIYQSLLQK